jgi:hypothetical protein
MNVLNDVFNRAMAREHKTVTVRTSGEEFNAFFRKNADTTTRKDTMVMFYGIDAPVSVGSLLCFGGNTYLVLNKETAENTVYYKSAIIRTNGAITTHNLSVIDLPFYGADVNNDNTTGNTHLTIIDGNVDVMTEDNADSRNLQIGDKLNEWGRTWSISNLFYVDGICHVVLEVEQDETPIYNYRLELSNLNSYNVQPEDTDTLTVTAYINNVRVDDAAITFSSSNNDVATISAEGEIVYLADGSVIFTATWGDYATAETASVTVVTAPVDDGVAIYVDPLEAICYDFPETLRYYATRGGVRDDSIPVLFRIENLSNPAPAYQKRITITDNGDHTIELAVNGSVMYQKSFDLVAYVDGEDAENRQRIKIDSLF